MGWVSEETRAKVAAAYRGLAFAQRRLRRATKSGRAFDPNWVEEAEKRVERMKDLMLREASR